MDGGRCFPAGLREKSNCWEFNTAWREHLPPNEFPLGLLFIYSISPRLIENPSEAVISQCSLRLER